MSNITATIVINATQQAAQAIRENIASQPGSQVQLSQRKNIDGSTAGWILIATLSAQALPHVLGFIKDYLSSKQVKKIKVGDWEVENPTPEILERFLATMDSKALLKKDD